MISRNFLTNVPCFVQRRRVLHTLVRVQAQKVSFVTSNQCYSCGGRIRESLPVVGSVGGIVSSCLLQFATRRWAGHSKWSKIKHKKGAKDLNKAKLFSKATKAIRVASRLCGGDLANLHLQSAIQAARSLQVPKDRIEDAIQNVKSNSSDNEVVAQRYDGHIVTASGKVAVITMALTDNKNRTASNLRTIFRKANGDLLNTGSNSFFFDHLGIILVKKQHQSYHNHDLLVEEEAEAKEKEKEEDENKDDVISSSKVIHELSEEFQEQLMECALENGALDLDFGSDTDEHVLLKCEPTDLFSLAKAVKDDGYDLGEFESAYIVKNESDGGITVQLDQESSEQLEDFLTKMDEDEDVSSVYHNAIIS